MIINISGTGGSGKSTIVRQIMSCYETIEIHHIENRKRPIGYNCFSTDNEKSLWVVGSYTSPCGGCDTLASLGKNESMGMLDIIYRLIRSAHKPDRNVIYEGLLIGEDVRRCVELHTEGYPLIVLSIELPLEECMKSILERRKRKGKFDIPKPKNPKKTLQRYRSINNRMRRLTKAGINTQFLSRRDVFYFCCEEFGMPIKTPPTFDETEEILEGRL